MQHPNRINPTSATPTIARQTPKLDFGEVLAQNLGTAANYGGAMLGYMVPGVSTVSTAVPGAAMLSGVLPVPVSGNPSSSAARSSSIAPGTRGDSWDLLRAHDEQSKEYLALQNHMQRESREFNALSNVLKVRHESAKAAINNLR